MSETIDISRLLVYLWVILCLGVGRGITVGDMRALRLFRSKYVSIDTEEMLSQLKAFVRVQMHHALVVRAFTIGMGVVVGLSIMGGWIKPLDFPVFLVIFFGSAIFTRGAKGSMEALQCMPVEEQYRQQFQHVLHVWIFKMLPDW